MNPQHTVIERISLLPKPQRAARLQQAGYNVFCLKRCVCVGGVVVCVHLGFDASNILPTSPAPHASPCTHNSQEEIIYMHLYSQEVFINLLTESGMGALSCPPPHTNAQHTVGLAARRCSLIC